MLSSSIHNIVHILSVAMMAILFKARNSKAPLFYIIINNQNIMQKIIAYLKENWKHLSIAVIMAIYNILVQSGVIPASDQLIINGILAALGISLTSNSGTKDAMKQ